MSDTVKLWFFILLLPVLAAVGHDFYANYLIDPEKQAQLEALNVDPEEYMASDVGYLLVNYAPEFYDNTKISVGEEDWVKYVDPLLQQYTWVVALVPFGLFLLGFLLMKIVNLPSMPRKAKLANDPFLKHEKQETFKYKRR